MVDKDSGVRYDRVLQIGESSMMVMNMTIHPQKKSG